MNEQRILAYLNLINQLLTCNEGDETRILQENQELVDEGLGQVMVAVAQQYGEARRENEAQWLMNRLQQLAAALGLSGDETTATANTPQDYLNFLMETLQKISENPNPQIIYPFWAQNLDKLDDNLARILDSWTRDRLTQVPPEQAYFIAGDIVNFSNLIQQFPVGNIAANKEIAITGYKIALTIFTFNAFPQDWATTQNNLANAYSDRIRGEKAENLETAISCYQEALKVFRPQTLPNDCRRTARLLGNLYGRENRWQEAVPAYQTALEALEVLYEDSLTLLGKQEELAATGDLFHRTAYALTRTGEFKSAVVTLESGRARGLRETLERDRADLERVKETAPEVYASYQQAASLLRDLEIQERLRNTLEAKAEIRATPAAILQQTQQARQQLTAAIQQIRQLPGYEKFLTLPTFEDISRSLQPNQPLIYLTTNEYGSLALIVERSPLSRGAKGGSPSSLVVENSITPLEIDNLNDTQLRELLGGTETSWFEAYDNRQNNRQNWFDAIDRVTNELWSKLMQPVISHLQTREVKQAILIPTGLLGLLPLHAAWTEDLSKPCKRRYALDEISFTYAPNALSLNNAREIARRVSPDTMLAVDNPRNNLPNSEKEVQTAIETFPNHRIFKHEQATGVAVKNALPDYAVLHFSCHGFADFNEPLNSGLLMANDEILSLRDLFELNLTGIQNPKSKTQNPITGIRLAVLSACETALPGIENIDEVISLPIGMLQTGVAGAVASLWSVSDISTMMLLARFYDLWRKENLELPEALRQAQLWVRDTNNGEKVAYFKNFLPEFSGTKMATETADALYKTVIRKSPDVYDFAHPFHWSAFTYTGV